MHIGSHFMPSQITPIPLVDVAKTLLTSNAKLIDEEESDCAFRPSTRPFTRLSCTSNVRFSRHMHMDRWCFHRVHKSRINMYETVCIEIIRYYLVSFYTRIAAIFFPYILAATILCKFRCWSRLIIKYHRGWYRYLRRIGCSVLQCKIIKQLFIASYIIMERLQLLSLSIARFNWLCFLLQIRLDTCRAAFLNWCSAIREVIL